MNEIYNTRDTEQYQDQTKIPDLIHQYYNKPMLINEPIINLYQYLKAVSTMLQASIITETDSNYKTHLIGRLYELQHILYIIDKPDAMKERIELSTYINT